jgi:tRNA pseudouridine38/39 synthase
MQHSDQSHILKSLGLKNSEEALTVLQQLVTQNIVNQSQIKNILRSCNNSSKANPPTRVDKDHESKYMTRHVSLRFHYDGANFNGLAQNVNSPLDNSVEKVLFQALEKTCLINSREDCGYSRSGRTDKGVSAFGQVIALRVRSKFPKGTEFVDGNGKRRIISEEDLPRNAMTSIPCWTPKVHSKKKKGSKRKLDQPEGGEMSIGEQIPLVPCDMCEKDFAQILNNVLPPTIRVLGWSPVSQGFSARFSTASRTYRYFFVKRDLNLEAMRKGLEYMLGRHDFRNFCKMNVKEVDNFERVILDGKIIASNATLSDPWPYCEFHGNTLDPLGDKNGQGDDSTYRQVCYFDIKGQAFLWHQIRCIVSVLFMIGKGHESPEVVKSLLDVQNVEGKPSYPFAPELPLVLHHCEYKNVRFGHTVKNLWKVSCDLENKWEEIMLSAERIKNGILSLRSEAEVHKHDLLDFVKNILHEREQKQKKLETNSFMKVDSKILPEPNNAILTWEEAMKYIREHTGLRPDIQGPIVQLHYPLMNRARGTKYEEKVSFLEHEQDSVGKRRFNECMKKKESNNGDDELFYHRMSSEGGSGFYEMYNHTDEELG